MWDQIRVDKGKEFNLVLYIQEKNADYRMNRTRQPYKQTESKRVSYKNNFLPSPSLW